MTKNEMLSSVASTAEILADFRAGKMVILIDDEDRENEGDLLIAADFVTPEAINFMARHARGLVCLTLTEERCRRLRLPLMTAVNGTKMSTNFTMSIEAAEGVTTGISAADRARTIQAAVAADAKPSDIVQPGHVFPVMARPGGVLTRAGHTEAGCDLGALTGLTPSAVICEIMKEDGTMARLPDLIEFAREHGLKIGTIADLIAYRLEREQTIARIAQCELPTEYGTFTLTAYQNIYDNDRLHYALSKGKIQAARPTFVRVHVQNTLGDLFHASLSERTHTLQEALQRLAQEPDGIIVVLDDAQSHNDIISRMVAFSHNNPPPKRPQEQDLRTYGIGAQILIDQGVGKMRLLSAPYKFTGISGYQLEVSEYLAE